MIHCYPSQACDAYGNRSYFLLERTYFTLHKFLIMVMHTQRTNAIEPDMASVVGAAVTVPVVVIGSA